MVAEMVGEMIVKLELVLSSMMTKLFLKLVSMLVATLLPTQRWIVVVVVFVMLVGEELEEDELDVVLGSSCAKEDTLH